LATLPFFVIGPSALLALIGLIRGPRLVDEPKPEVVSEIKVDVVIPAYNESDTIALCLASVARQTVKPHSITVIDDGSKDETADIAEAFAAVNNIAIRVIRRRQSIGKTPGVKRESRALEGDVEFILDADTILESPDYIEKVVAQLYRVPGIAAAFGYIYPLREQDRDAMMREDSVRRLIESYPTVKVRPSRSVLHRISKGAGNFYRDTLYHFMQNFLYRGLQNLFGSTMNPIGCAVAYRREYLRELFDQYEPRLGDNLTTSEDIFFGAAFIAYGYHNRQVPGVIARSEEPEVQRLPRQLFLWSSAWLQTAYYLPSVLFSPFRVLKRWRHERRTTEVRERRRIADGYRQPFGLRFAGQFGRPAGWAIFFALLEKISYPVALVILLAIGAWRIVAITLAAEVIIYALILAVFSQKFSLWTIIKGIVATPLRYATMAFDVFTITRFLIDLITLRRDWRK
jgi:glycosyltransferase involved in cell wall biosynthesis